MCCVVVGPGFYGKDWEIERRAAAEWTCYALTGGRPGYGPPSAAAHQLRLAPLVVRSGATRNRQIPHAFPRRCCRAFVRGRALEIGRGRCRAAVRGRAGVAVRPCAVVLYNLKSAEVVAIPPCTVVQVETGGSCHAFARRRGRLAGRRSRLATQGQERRRRQGFSRAAETLPM